MSTDLVTILSTPNPSIPPAESFAGLIRSVYVLILVCDVNLWRIT